MIEAENASFTYQSAPSPALQDVTLTVQPGECVVLCGRSGCGKTTFTHLLNGLSPEFYPGTLTGRCTAAGLAAGEAAIEAYVPQVGSVFQNPKTQYFNVDTTAELAFPCENAGMEPQAIRRRVDVVVEQFQLGSLMDRSVFKLSGGEKQRVAFAAACMLGPRLLVLDEPTSNLDAAAIAQLHDMIAVMKQQGVTVVLAEHRLAWITDLADRYFFFAAGRLAAQWSAAEFAALPADTLTGYGLRARTLDDCRAGIRAKQSARCPGTPVLTLEGVTLGCDKKHPLRTLPDMSFAAGEIVGLMGRNGIGKSTMARTLCGLLEPVSGKICRNGRPANARERLRSSCIAWTDADGNPLGRAVYHLDHVLERGLEGKENALFVAEDVPADWPFRCLLAMEPMPPRAARLQGGLLSHLHFQYASGPEHLFDPDTHALRSPLWYATMCDGDGTLLEQCNIVRALHRLPVWEELPEL